MATTRLTKRSSCSISGAIANREQCPAIPYTPAEYASEARRIVDEGGVMIHIHARKPDGTPSYEVEDFAAINEVYARHMPDPPPARPASRRSGWRRWGRVRWV